MNKEKLEQLIEEQEYELNALRLQLRDIKTKENSNNVKRYIGKYFIQHMFESGTRYMYVNKALSIKSLEFYMCGAYWDKRNCLVVIPPEKAIWLENCNLGYLTEASREDFFKILKDDIYANIDELLNNV